MSDFKDVNGETLPSSLVKYTRIPRQMSSKEEAEKVEDQGSTASGSAQNAVVSNVIVNVLMAGSLTLVWGLIEGL